jgi:hypothetical protein
MKLPGLWQCWNILLFWPFQGVLTFSLPQPLIGDSLSPSYDWPPQDFHFEAFWSVLPGLCRQSYESFSPTFGMFFTIRFQVCAGIVEKYYMLQ